jgi:peptidoglycan/LPS O-acetylase OafA/YrhL
MNYLKHIDGLRAVAIISVILFHLNLEYFKGGFIGVDIFFVISGFLITRWFIKRDSNKNFNLLKIFYENRIKRLIPLLFFVKIIILISGFVLMNTNQFKLLIDQNLYSLFFLSNIYLWKNSDYFSLNTFENPLVHTWSLSLEEQFAFENKILQSI